jgi:hypothetical protein
MSHHEKGEPAERDIDVAHELEEELTEVEEAVHEFLGTLAESAKNKLLATLDQVDEQSKASDIYIGRFSYPYAPHSSAVGATSLNPIIDQVPGTIFEAQVDLVKAAKQALMKTTAESLADLRSAVAALQEMRGPD